jgi:predicted transcriptional regulator
MHKTYRTVYLNEELEKRLEKLADVEQSSVSRMVRIALKQYLRAADPQENGTDVKTTNHKENGDQENV